MKITVLTPMEVEKNKVLESFQRLNTVKHSYEVIVCGIGRENLAKGMLNKPESDITILIGFTAITGKEKTLPEELHKGEVVEVTASSLFGYEGHIFENGSIKLTKSKTNLPCLSSLTSDKFIRTTNIPMGTLINMEDYTFMCLKNESDFIIRVISDLLPHQEELDFFEEIKEINFDKAIEILEAME